MPPPPQLHIMICGLSVGLGPCSERGRADLPYRSGDGARRHLCAVTASPACQRFPGRELPSPMLTARQPDELSVSSNSPPHLSQYSTTWKEPLFRIPPGLIALFCTWCVSFQLFNRYMATTISGRPLNQEYMRWRLQEPVEGYTGWQGITMATLSFVCRI